MDDGHAGRAQPAALRAGLLWLTAIALWLATGVLLAALGASFSRGAWLGAAAGLFGMLLGLGGRAAWFGALLALGAALFLALGGAQFLPEALAARLASMIRVFNFFDPSSVAVTPENFAVIERMAQLWAGWKMWLAHPLVGVGPGSYTLAYQEFTAGPWFASRGHAHNYYLHIAAEAGLVGLASYLALLGSVVADLRVGLRRAGSALQGTALLGICGMIAAMAGHNLFENLHVLHLSVQSAAAWGMAAALAQPPEGTN
jgi:O-antigen ligase